MFRSPHVPHSRKTAARAVLGALLASVALVWGCSKNDEVAPETAPVQEPAKAPPSPGAQAVGEPAAPPAAALPARRFLVVEGEVVVNGNPASVGTEIPADATLKTGKNARAVITLAPDSVIELRANTQVVATTSERKAMSMKLALGALWSLLPSGSSYEVTTENAVAGVRGTTFFVEAATKKPDYICACDGEVDITAAGKKKPSSKTVRSAKGHLGFAVRPGKTGKIAKAPMRGHTDDQAEVLEGLRAQTRVDAPAK